MCTLESRCQPIVSGALSPHGKRESLRSFAVRCLLGLSGTALVVFAGCATRPQFVRPAVPVPPAYKEGEANAVADESWKIAQPSDAASRGEWWRIFNDPRLSALEEKAAVSDQNIVAATDSFLAARALVREAHSQYFPSLATNPSIVNQQPSPAQFAGVHTGSSSLSGITLQSYTAYQLPFDASWEPDLWGRVRNQVRASVAAAQLSAADLENVRLSDQAELAVDYYELRAQDSLKEVFDATVAADREGLNLTRSLYQGGLDNEEAVAQAEAQWKAAQAQDANLGILRAQYEHAIAVLTGQPASAFSLAAEPLPDDPPIVPAGIPSDLLERRPDIAAAERAVAQANAQLGVAKTAYYPNLVLSAAGGLASSSIASWFAWPSKFWSVGPSLAETLFDAGLRGATVNQNRAVYDQTVANYRQAVLTAFQQVEDNLASLRILSQNIEQQDAAVEAARRSYREANVRFEAGLDPYLNVISAQAILLADQQTAVNFRTQQIVASVQLIKALGGGWDESQLPSARQINGSNPPVSAAAAGH